MLQLRELPTIEILQKFSDRYPEADISAVSTFLNLLRVAGELSVALDACLSRHDLLQGRWWVLILLMPDYYSRLRQCMQALSEPGREKLQQLLGVINAGASALLNK